MNIMIIGATRGIGLALATHYASQGARLALCGRDIGRMDRHPLRSHAGVRLYQFDIADRCALARAIQEFGKDRLDLVIVAAGQYVDAASLATQPACGVALMQTNVVGLVQAFDAAAAVMILQQYGQLVAIASMAGLIEDYPGASLYSASKRAALAVCNVYRKALAPFGIAVTAIVPGYVDTVRLRELNGGDASRKPFLQSEAVAVSQIADAIRRRKHQCVFPWQMHLLVRLFNFLPQGLRALRRK